MAVKRKTSSTATGTRASAKRGKKPAAKSSALTRTAGSRLRRKKAPPKSASKSRLTKVAVAVGTALGRTERVVRNAGQGAVDAKDAFGAKITAISEQLGRAGTEFKRTVARKSR